MPSAPRLHQNGTFAGSEKSLPYGASGFVLERCRAVEVHAVTFAHDARLRIGGDVDHQLRRPVARARAEVGDAGVARRLVRRGRVVEHELGDVERVLVERRHLVLLVRAPPRRGVRAGLIVGGHVDEAHVERHRRGDDDLGIVGELGEQVQRRDVLEHVDVRVVLEEAEVGALGDPVEDVGLRPLEMFGAGEAGDGERLVGVALPRQVLDREVDDPVVLRPEPQVVDAVGGQRIVVAVAVGEHPLVDRGDHVGRQLRRGRVALAESEHPVQVHETEVAGVLPRIDLREHGRQRLDGHVLDRPREVGITMGTTEVGVDAGRVGGVLGGGREGEVVVDAHLPDRFVDQPGRARRDERSSGGAERHGRGGVGRGAVGGGIGHRRLRCRIAGRGRRHVGVGVVTARTARHDGSRRPGADQQEPAPVQRESLRRFGR